MSALLSTEMTSKTRRLMLDKTDCLDLWSSIYSVVKWSYHDYIKGIGLIQLFSIKFI